jgi:uncharacterized protein YxjI
MSDSNYLFKINNLVMKKRFFLSGNIDFQDIKGASLASAEANFGQIPPKNLSSSTRMVQSSCVFREKWFSLRSEFVIYDSQGVALGTSRRKIAKLIGEEFWVEKDGVEFMRIYGDFTEHDYRFEVNGSAVASIHKKWVSLRDEIGISMTGLVDHRVVLGAVIVIEHIEVSERQSNSS